MERAMTLSNEEKRRKRDKLERGVALYFLAAVVAPFLPIVLAPGYPISTRVAAGGGLLAALGGLSIIRPVIRAGGPYNWVILEQFGDIDPSLFRDGEELKTQLAKVNDPDALKTDRFVQHIFGPFFIGVGTLINGFSGFFS
jgi:hypothetical protein